MQVMVIGLGYVGLTAAAITARLGHQVLGVDVDPNRLSTIKKGDPGFYEKGMKELLAEGFENGRLVVSHPDDVGYEPMDVVMVTVGTPPMPDGSADMSQIKTAVRWAVSKGLGSAVLVMKSSVSPGTGIMIVKNELEGTGWQYASNPEFLRQGSAVEDWLKPSRIVIGTSEARALEVVEALYAGVDAPVVRTDITSAEMIKYTSNAMLVTRISFINEIASLCEKVGGHIDDVTLGVALDPRIGPSFLGAGIGWGGSCFPKDVRALEHLASMNGNSFDLLRAVISVNDRQRVLPLQALHKVFGDLAGIPVAVLGLTFKPETDDLREAPAIPLICALTEAGAQVRAYDPVAIQQARALLDGPVDLMADPMEALAGARAAVLATEWKQIVQLPWEEVSSVMAEPRFVFDGRNALDLRRWRVWASNTGAWAGLPTAYETSSDGP